jgi:hypothetical protein
MSIEEIKHAVQNRKTIEPEGITENDLRIAGCLGRVAVLPYDRRERMSYLADVLVQSVNNELVKDDKLRLVVGRLCHALSYIINSCSWQEDELHDFDYRELQSKLKPFMRSE